MCNMCMLVYVVILHRTESQTADCKNPWDTISVNIGHFFPPLILAHSFFTL